MKRTFTNKATRDRLAQVGISTKRETAEHREERLRRMREYTRIWKREQAA